MIDLDVLGGEVLATSNELGASLADSIPLLDLAEEPEAQVSRECAALLTEAISRLKDDAGATLTPEAKDAWGTLYQSDQAEFERLRKAAKVGGARVVEIDKLIGIRAKFPSGEKRRSILKKSSTSSTSSTGAGFRPIEAAQEVLDVLDRVLPDQPGALVTFDEEGTPRRMVASNAALAVRDVLLGRYARCASSDIWHRFTGSHWEADPKDENLNRDLIAWMYPACDPLGFTPRYMADILTVVGKGALCPLSTPAPGLIPFQNGLLDVSTGDLQPVSPDNALTWSLPYDFDPSAECPTVKGWLLRTVDGDGETLELLRAWLAALLTGRADLQRFLHLPGPGGSGKGTFLRLCAALVGAQNVASSDLKALEQNRFETASLYGKRLVLITDSDKYGGSINVLKALTGQDPLRLERKNVQQNGTFTFGGLVMLASNEPLMTTDLTSGLERRRITVEFNKPATQEEIQAWKAQGGEESVLHREIPGVVNWALGLSPAEVSRIIASPPVRTQDANLEALTAGNPIAGWLVDCCAPAPGEWTQVGNKVEIRHWDGRIIFEHEEDWLYPNYLAWSKRNGREALALRRFRHTVKDQSRVLGVDVQEPRAGKGRGIKGLRLLRMNEAPHPWTYGSSTSNTASAGSAALKPAPVLEVLDVLDFSANFVCGSQEKEHTLSLGFQAPHSVPASGDEEVF